MIKYYGIFSKSNKEDEEEKKKTPSQVAREEVKKSKYHGVFEGIGTDVSKKREESIKKEELAKLSKFSTVISLDFKPGTFFIKSLSLYIDFITKPRTSLI